MGKKPVLERLEDRCTPSITSTWTNNHATALYSDPLNWTNGVPGAGDEADFVASSPGCIVDSNAPSEIGYISEGTSDNFYTGLLIIQKNVVFDKFDMDSNLKINHMNTLTIGNNGVVDFMHWNHGNILSDSTTAVGTLKIAGDCTLTDDLFGGSTAFNLTANISLVGTSGNTAYFKYGNIGGGATSGRIQFCQNCYLEANQYAEIDLSRTIGDSQVVFLTDSASSTSYMNVKSGCTLDIQCGGLSMSSDVPLFASQGTFNFNDNNNSGSFDFISRTSSMWSISITSGTTTVFGGNLEAGQTNGEGFNISGTAQVIVDHLATLTGFADSRIVRGALYDFGTVDVSNNTFSISNAVVATYGSNHGVINANSISLNSGGLQVGISDQNGVNNSGLLTINGALSLTNGSVISENSSWSSSATQLVVNGNITITGSNDLELSLPTTGGPVSVPSITWDVLSVTGTRSGAFSGVMVTNSWTGTDGKQHSGIWNEGWSGNDYDFSLASVS